MNKFGTIFSHPQRYKSMDYQQKSKLLDVRK